MDSYLAADIARGLIIVLFFVVVRVTTRPPSAEPDMVDQLDNIKALPEVER